MICRSMLMMAGIVVLVGAVLSADAAPITSTAARRSLLRSSSEVVSEIYSGSSEGSPFPAEVAIEVISEFYLPASASEARKGKRGRKANGRGLLAADDLVPGEPELDVGAGEQLYLDKDARIAYVVGETALINVIDYADPAKPELLKTFAIPETGTDIEVCDGIVAVGMEGEEVTSPGQILFYKGYAMDPEMPLLYTVSTGPLPDMIHFSDDCSKMVVAIEAEGSDTDDGFVNPPGGVMVLNWDGDLTVEPTVANLNFDAFSGEELYKPDGSGVLWSYRPDNCDTPGQCSFQQDLEPEYVAFNEDASMAFIGIQENNAVAFVSLGDTPKVEAIAPLGLKRWKKLTIDASDKDDGVNMVKGYKIFGAYQPDTIKTFFVDGKTYLVTANEGDAKEYDNWEEEARGEDIAEKCLACEAEPCCVFSAKMLAKLSDETELGRLNFLSRYGFNEDGQQFRLIAEGGRGVSIFEMTDDFQAKLKWDSGDEIEAAHAEQDPEGSLGFFNPDQLDDPEDTVPDGFDRRSDNKGVETESLDIGECGGSKLLFVGNERSSSLTIYDITLFPETAPVLISTTPLANPTSNLSATWEELFNSRTIGIVDPESMMYVPDSDTSGHLYVAGAVSGTISVYKITAERWNYEGQEEGLTPGPPMLIAVGRASLDLGVLILSHEYFQFIP
eukprot:CAMPEP_0117669582 /NCGR_PEP_ID=MMETSP0804-20121206/12217_1 /TAXON_ID=1074897 /ORGANISM="Tetraselmis astigmatica, Strain CCMP880" /LENGTH=671 /DNA_ID=CAMNT_0005477665 /DNA_START=40 /DNA_END=2052 /DNA_ORIENTATION=+